MIKTQVRRFLEVHREPNQPGSIIVSSRCCLLLKIYCPYLKNVNQYVIFNAMFCARFTCTRCSYIY
jgi:hypothetical protein